MKYLLTFKPLKNFFFGNERTFKDDYLAKSEYFPQNTQLLGAIRLFIAEQNKLMHIHKNGKYSNEPEKLKLLIGTASSKDFEKNDNLGMIRNLSQMFLVSQDLNDAYFPTPFDIEINDKKVRYYELANFEDDYFLKDYDVKNSSSQKLGNNNFWQKYINHQKLSIEDLEDFDFDEETKQGVFIKHRQVGIELENKRVVDEKFYSKIDYQLNDKFLFASIIELDEKIINNGIIQIGAESSLFELKVLPLEDTKLNTHLIISSLFKNHEIQDKLVLISDAMLENTSDFKASFNIVPFYKSFAMLNNDYDKYKGRVYQKRVAPVGTVSYKNNNIPKEPKGAYAKMGYNQYITIKY